MPAPRRIFVAATNQHVGKTTATLGLISSLQKHGIQVGYCKPLGQKFVEIKGEKVDKDAPIFTSFLDETLVPRLHSPVIMAQGLTCHYLENPQNYHFEDKVLAAARSLEATHDVMVYEGTGHPGVGSVLDMSNADTAHLLNAGVILIVEGGIGKTIDQINLNRSYFESRGVSILGVIINKVLPEKLEKVSRWVGAKLNTLGIPLLGVIPYEARLGQPVIQAIQKATKAEVLTHPEKLNEPIEGLMSLQDTYRLPDSPLQGQLLIIDAMQLDACIQGFNFQFPHQMPLNGVLLTGENYLSPLAMRFLEKHQLPCLFTHMNAYEAVLAYGKIETKLRPDVGWKVREAAELVSNHMDLSPLFRQMAVA